MVNAQKGKDLWTAENAERRSVRSAESAERIERTMLGKMLIVIGTLTALVGAWLLWTERYGLGGLPGDVVWRRGNWTVYLPFGLMIVASVVLTLVLTLFWRR